MRIKLKSEVRGNYKEVMRRFDRELFEALLPGNASVEILEFSGSEKDDRLHLRFHRPVKTEWISLITENVENENEAWFVDQGIQLPWPLSYWRHKHMVRKISDGRSLIIDDISFKATNPLFTILMYPLIYIGFYPRKKQYKQYFGS